MGSTDIVERAVRAHVRAFNQRDIDALMAGLLDDVTWATGRDVLRGADAVRQLFANAFATLAPTLSVVSVIAADDVAACELRERLTHRGVTREDHIAGFYRFRGRQINSVKIYREGSADVDGRPGASST
jgi:hypothetical protein